MTQVAENFGDAAPQAERSALRRWPRFVLIGVALYAALYVWAENIVHRHAERNRFYMVATATQPAYDFVVLGASHAMPLGYDDFNGVLEEASGALVIGFPGRGMRRFGRSGGR